MQSEIDEKKFIEYAEVHGNFYGTSYRTVEDISATGRCCILELDIQGAHQLRDSVYLFFSFPFPFVCVCVTREDKKDKVTRYAFQLLFYYYYYYIG